MIFPKPPHGRFVQSPTVFTTEDPHVIKWTLPEKCDHNSYEVQEAGYESDSGKLWGGMSASCAQTENGFECQAEEHPQMKEKDGPWQVQSSSYGCEGDGYFISDIVSVR
jgi:hypothetical protein